MKHLMIVLLATSSMFLLSDGNLEGISKAMRTGDANALSSYLDSDVELTILDDVNILDKQAAKKAIDSFFKANKPTGYSQVHKGTSKGQKGQYSIGNLTTERGKFRVYIYLDVQGDKQLIQELRFEK